MNTLFVTMLVPAPPDRGDRIRGYEMLEALAEFSEVHVALVGNQMLSAEAKDALERIGVRSIRRFPLTVLQKVSGTLAAAIMGRPWATLHSPRVARELVRWDSSWNAVVAFQLKSAYFACGVPAKLRILELTDSLGRYRHELARARKALRWLSLTGAAREEARWASKYDFTILSSEADVQAVARDSAGTQVFAAENGTIAWEFPVQHGRKDCLLFVGSLFYPPNRDGVLWFLKYIWPSISVDHPALSFRVVGEGPERMRRAIQGPRVTWAGYVPDLEAEYRGALALVNPVQYGSGTRRKVLTAWGAGLPVVSTRKGAEGLDFVEGKHLIVADDVEDFRSAVSLLLRRSSLWRQMSLAGWQHAHSRYSSRQIWRATLSRLFGRETT